MIGTSPPAELAHSEYRAAGDRAELAELGPDPTVAPSGYDVRRAQDGFGAAHESLCTLGGCAPCTRHLANPRRRGGCRPSVRRPYR